MKYLLILAPFFLAGCITQEVPVKQVWPDVPKELLESCPDLKKVSPDAAKLSDIIEVVADNYSTYYDCKSKVDDWITWYNGQKKIQDGK
jgi:hypothetical protein